MRVSKLVGMALIAILISINFVACSDDNGDEQDNPNGTSVITIDPSIITNGLVFAVGGSEQYINFTTNADWTLNIASTTSGSVWCTASATSGNKGDISVKFTTTENKDYSDRSVAVTIKAGTVSKTFTVIQKCKEAILLTTDKYEVSQEGGFINVEVKSNIDYQMEVSEKAKSWITQTNTRTLTTYNYTFKIAANEEYEKREGEILFKKGNYIETVRVYQAGDAVLMLTKDEYAVSDKGETITVEIKSNMEYGVKMPQVDWIYDEASVRGTSSHTLKYVISPNETYDSRSAQIIYYDKNDVANADTLTIMQVQKDAIIVANNEYIIDSKGEIIEVELSSNIDYTISVDDDGKDWISRIEKTRTLTTNKINFKIAENPSDDSRISYITFDSGNGVSQKIKITQKGAGITIYVAIAGTLSELIDSSVKDEITRLKITGNLNSDDIEFLRKMKKIQILDLSEVNTRLGSYAFQLCSTLTSIIIPNGVTSLEDCAFYGCRNLTSVVIPNSVINIGKNVFDQCSSLASIIIPNSVTSIGDFAFNGCRSLTSIIIPNSVTSIGDAGFSDCSSLISISVDKDNSIYSSIDGVLYNKNITTLIQFPGGKSSITIPNSVSSIGDFAFSECKNLTSIVIPNGVTNIGFYAFQYSRNLTSITIPKSVTSIRNRAFIACPNLISINVDEDNSEYLSIDGALYNSYATTLIQCPGGKTSITFPYNVQCIGDNAFLGCKSLVSIIIPNTVLSIEWNAFGSCTNLASITIPNSVTDFGTNVFAYCSNIEEIHLKYESILGMNPLLFSDVNKERCILYVPRGCRNAYSIAPGWNEFKNIVEE